MLSANSKTVFVNRRGVSMKTPSEVGMDGLTISQMLARSRPVITANCDTGASLRYTASNFAEGPVHARASFIDQSCRYYASPGQLEVLVAAMLARPINAKQAGTHHVG